jgi:8-oxo-dGTP pyrophosphatase MutT (NUDIX family)
MKSLETLLDVRIRKILTSRQRCVLRGDTLTPAAILLPLFKKDNEYHILLTKRTHRVKTHKGEISFPGGTFDPEDETLEKTALRECFEEIGLREKDVEILGCLDDVETLTHYMVRPYVGILPYPYPFVVNDVEIEEIIELPLYLFLEKDCFEIKSVPVEKDERIIYSYRHGHHVIWGATAKILKQFVDLIRGTP